MSQNVEHTLSGCYPICRRVAKPGPWRRVLASHPTGTGPAEFSETLARHGAAAGVVPWLADLARLEWTCRTLESMAVPPAVDRFEVNPALELVKLSWCGLTDVMRHQGRGRQPRPAAGEELVLVWRQPGSGQLEVAPAGPLDLLALKVVVEYETPEAAAAAGAVPVGTIETVIRHGATRGILLAPESRIRRDPANFGRAGAEWAEFSSAQVFTLQWHITQECDLHCRHCYDRSERRAVTLDEGLRVLDEMHRFCRDRAVAGQVSFSGGNPLLHPDFLPLYRAAAERGFMLAILGNPVERVRLEELLAIRRPVLFQISLEGLEDHNDLIRGAGHYRRSMAFLGLLRELAIPSFVMLTLTRENLSQVLPLAERLRGATDGFTFNRLARFGEGADLELPERDEYAAFLRYYLAATADNPVLCLKDGLLELIRHRQGEPPFGGCAGFGCGAAFNFVALLADGEVHACRKFPSPIGHLGRNSLAEIYDSAAAQQYRSGSSSCAGCPVRPVCGGCPAVTASQGLDRFQDRDPFCLR